MNSDIGSFLFLYKEKSQKIDKILSILTKEYCASDACPGIKNIGCCVAGSYNINSLDEFCELQLNEAKNNDWNSDGLTCKYHSQDKGCYLTDYKSPLCLGQVCITLENAVKKIDNEIGINFVISMRNFAFSDMKKEQNKVITLMDNAIDYGERLVLKKLN